MKLKMLSFILFAVIFMGQSSIIVAADTSDFVIDNGVLLDYVGAGGKVTIPSNVTKVSSDFLYSANADKITELIIHKNLVAEPGALSYMDNLEKVVFEEGSTSIIGDFFGCDKLTEIIIPSSVTEASRTFTYYVQLEAFAETPWLLNQKAEFVIVGDGLLLKHNGKDDHIIIPDTVKYIGVQAITGNEAKAITIPSSVVTIGDAAFLSSNFTEVNLSEGLKTIGSRAFANVPINEITIPKSVETIYETAFMDHGNNTLTIFGYTNSVAQKFAEENKDSFNLKFSAIDTQDIRQQTATAVPTNSKIYVNDTEKGFEAYNINGNNYFKLRDLASVLNETEKQFEVTWDNVNNAISLIPNKSYTAVGGELTLSGKLENKQATLTSSKLYLNGNEISLTAYNIGGNNYFKLRDIGKAFDFGVNWDDKTQSIVITTSTGYIEN